MLKLKYLFENYQLVRTALNHWKYDEETLDELTKYFRISSNAIYPFASNGKICFLRLAPTDEKIEKNIIGEMEFILYLREKEFPALAPVPSKDGDYVKKINCQWGKYFASVFEKVDGCQIEDTDYSDEIMFQYGKTLGILHSLSSRFIPKTKKWDHVEVLEWIYKTIREYNAPEYIFNALELTKKEMLLLPTDPNHYGLVHYDFEPDNVFYNSKDKTCSVIDFDDGMYHWYALDIEQVFDALGDEFDKNKLEQAKKKFIRGYKTEFFYSEETEKMLPLMRRFCDLYSYARLIRCVDEKLDNEPEWMVNLRKTLNLKIDKLRGNLQKSQKSM